MSIASAKNQGYKRLMNAVAAGTSTQTSSTLDMQGFESADLQVAFGAITAGSLTTVQVQESTDDVTYTLVGTAVAIADTDDNHVAVIDMIRPLKRYLQVVIVRATQNAVIDSVFARRYGAHKKPVTQDATVISVTTVVST